MDDGRYAPIAEVPDAGQETVYVVALRKGLATDESDGQDDGRRGVCHTRMPLET